MSSEGKKSTPSYNIGAENLGMQKQLSEDTRKAEGVNDGKAKGQKADVANQGEQKSSGGKKSKKKKATNWIDFDTSPWGLTPDVPNPPTAEVRNLTYAEVVGCGVNQQPSASSPIQQPLPMNPLICKSDMHIFPKLTGPVLSPNSKLQSQTRTGVTVENIAAADKGDVRTNAGAGCSKFNPCKMLVKAKVKTTKTLPPTPPMKKCDEPNSIAMALDQAQSSAVQNSFVNTEVKTNQVCEIPGAIAPPTPTPAFAFNPIWSTVSNFRAQAVPDEILIIKRQQNKQESMSLFSHAPIPQLCVPFIIVQDNKAPTSTAALVSKGPVFVARGQPSAHTTPQWPKKPEYNTTTTSPSCSTAATKSRLIPQWKGKPRNLPFGMTVPEWNFLDLDRDLVAFPKFDHQFDDENYIAAEQKALAAMELAQRKNEEEKNISKEKK